ncbi:MAG TPA: adenosine deaminase family protein [Burkholderiaceae bacterium]|nr:adenosine deaminase family protein [Burkholderiaceae bacterium]
MTDTLAHARLARALPKVVLHDHLDGGLREQTLLDLLRARGIESPAADAAALGRWFDERAHAGSLTEYLRGFALTVAAMATPAALSRVAFEAAEDARAEGAVLAEFRIAPLLFEAHGIGGDAAVEALLEGLAQSPLPTGLIVCAMRHLPETETRRAAELALRWRGHGVIGFDLAGAELGHPATDHARAIALVRDAGLPLTLHAGEADAAPRVLEAVRLGAARIGHGVRLVDALVDDPGLVDAVREAGVHLEVCVSSNVHTGAARTVAEHPITALWRAGLSLSWQTDNRLMSRVTMTSEAQALLDETPLGEDDLRRMADEALRHAFLKPAPPAPRSPVP